MANKDSDGIPIPMCVLVGHNGAGKKTLLSSITRGSNIPEQVKNGLGDMPFEVVDTSKGDTERKTICKLMVVPCHMKYVSQMATRLYNAQLAIMVISSSVDNENHIELSRHCCFRLASLRIQKLFVAINFKDTEDAESNKKRYDEVKNFMSHNLTDAGYKEEAVIFFDLHALSRRNCKPIREAVVDHMRWAIENLQQPVEILADKWSKHDRFAANLVNSDLHLDLKLSRENWIQRLCIIYQTKFEEDELLINAGAEAASKAHELLEHDTSEFAEVLELLGYECRALGNLTGAKNYFERANEAIHHSAWRAKAATLSDRLSAVLKDLNRTIKNEKYNKVKKSEHGMRSESSKVEKKEAGHTKREEFTEEKATNEQDKALRMMSDAIKKKAARKKASANRGGKVAAQVAVATDRCSSSSLAKEEDWVGRSKVLVLSRSESRMKSLLFIFDLQHNRIMEEKIGGISYNMSNALVVRDTSIYSIGIFMDPENYNSLYINKDTYKDHMFYKGKDHMFYKGDVDFFHSGTSVLDLGAKDKKWKELTKIPPGGMEMPSSTILGHNIYAFKGSKSKVYDINRDKWENLIRPPELLESKTSMIAIYGESIQDPRIARHPVISDTVNNRLLVNFSYDLYAFYPDNKPESKWECLTNNKLGTKTICFLKSAQVFDDVIYFFSPNGTPYCIDAYDVTTNKHIKVSWSPEFNADVYNDSLVELVHFGLHVFDKTRIKLVHLGDGMMCLARSSRINDKSATCFRFVRFRVERRASPEEGVLITPATTHQFSLSTCYSHIGCAIPL